MELPDSVKAIGEQVEKGGDVTAAPELFEAYDVFAAELTNIFIQPWLAVDHASRLREDGDFLRADVGSRSVVFVRENADNIHALRNACLHAGYRVCEAEAGRAEQLYCVYHGWYYALDGKLTDPWLQPRMTDRSRFRLPRYAMRIERGLLLVDLTKVAPEAPPAGPVELGAIPEDLADRTVTRRQRYQSTLNWKQLRQFLWNEPGLAFGNGCDEVVEVGPLSYVALRNDDAALVRLVPKYPGQSEIEVVEMLRNGATASDADPIGDALRDRADAIAAPLDRPFYDWYWSKMAPPVAEA